MKDKIIQTINFFLCRMHFFQKNDALCRQKTHFFPGVAAFMQRKKFCNQRRPEAGFLEIADQREILLSWHTCRIHLHLPEVALL